MPRPDGVRCWHHDQLCQTPLSAPAGRLLLQRKTPYAWCDRQKAAQETEALTLTYLRRFSHNLPKACRPLRAGFRHHAEWQHIPECLMKAQISMPSFSTLFSGGLSLSFLIMIIS